MGTFQISIPKPCHENWATMSPREKGRFCDKCSKTVLDFTAKTPEEIEEYILLHENEKLCGRFMHRQIINPVRVEVSFPFFVNRLNSYQVFLLSLLITFGTTLFSCTTHNNETIGEINLTGSIVVDYPKNNSIEQFTKRIIVQEIPLIKSNMIAEIETTEIIKEKSVIPDKIVELPVVEIVAIRVPLVDCGSVGLFRICRIESHENKTLEDSDSLINTDKEINTNMVMEISNVYPNPAHDIINLKIKIEDENIVSADLFDLNGKLIRCVFPLQHMEAGERVIQFNVEDLPSATYLLRVILGEQVETKRIVVI